MQQRSVKETTGSSACRCSGLVVVLAEKELAMGCMMMWQLWLIVVLVCVCLSAPAFSATNKDGTYIQSLRSEQ